jgi:glycosyltransferase involved in cell wall biosynthesis/predicted Zn-dependent protease
MNKKLQKLIRDPKLFFSDMAIKHGRKLGAFKPKTHNGHYEYTVVSAVYNVGRYLEDYFDSLVKQRLDFKKHIHLVLVDDGSTDNSAEIIQRWKRKYPDNITYVHKENGGQASARNLGLQYVNTEWVTFIDPDDFVDPTYFQTVDTTAYANKHVKLLCTNLIFFYEDTGTYKNAHALKYKFKNGNNVAKLDKSADFIQLSAPSAFFNSTVIKDKNLTFNELIKPSFEDGEFVLRYMLSVSDTSVANLEKAKYYYRRRADNSSTVNTAWTKKEQYSNVIKFGFLSVLEEFEKKNSRAPEWVQRSIFYHLSWFFMQFAGKSNGIPALSNEETDDFVILVRQVLKHIDRDIIYRCKTPGFTLYYKMGVAQLAGIPQHDWNMLYVDNIDLNSETIKLKIFYYNESPCLDIIINGNEIIPFDEKIRTHNFGNSLFINEKIFFIKFNTKNEILSINSKAPINISMFGVETKNISIEKIIDLFKKNRPVTTSNESLQLLDHAEETDAIAQYSGAWLFSDRVSIARDNAEALYRHVHVIREKCYFILAKDSSDWERLESEGFSLLEYGSIEHKLALINAEMLISSHTDTRLLNKSNFSNKLNYKFVFLQHGITKDDISDWLNEEKIDLMIMTSIRELHSICSDMTNYNLSTHNCVLTGFPRHDLLIEKLFKDTILLAPTWRKSLTGIIDRETGFREINDEFLESEYMVKWGTLLRNGTLKNIADSYNCKVQFLPHPNMLQYVADLESGACVEILNPTEISYSDLLSKVKILITDYSSIAFEAAVINTPTIYYQFDQDHFFKGEHTTASGYFDYNKDGFGPVHTEEKQVIESINSLLKGDGKPSTEIQHRINKTFAFRDEKCCERTYQAICALENAQHFNPNANQLLKYAKKAQLARKFDLAISRWTQLTTLESKHYQDIAFPQIIEALREKGQLADAWAVFEEFVSNQPLWTENTWRVHALLKMAGHDWKEALANWANVSAKTTTTSDVLAYAKCLAELQELVKLEQLLNSPLAADLDTGPQQLLTARECMAQGNWQEASEMLTEALPWFDLNELSSLKPELLLSCCLRNLGKLNAAQAQLAAYEAHTHSDPQCREQIALLAQVRKQWPKVISQLEAAYPQLDDLPEPLVPIYIDALQQQKNWSASQQTIQRFSALYPQSTPLRMAMAKLLINTRVWDEAIVLIAAEFKGIDDPLRIALLDKIIVLREQGHLGKAQALFQLCFADHHSMPWAANVWREYAQLQMAKHNWTAASAAWAELAELNTQDVLNFAQCLAEDQQSEALEELLLSSAGQALNPTQRQLAFSWSAISNRQWSIAASILAAELPSFDINALRILKPQLSLSRCLHEQGLNDSAQKQLAAYEQHTPNDPLCREQIARLAHSQKQWSKVVSQLNKAYALTTDLPEALAPLYIQAMLMEQKYAQAEQALHALTALYPNNQTLQIEAAMLASNCMLWSQAILRWTTLMDATPEAPYYLANAYRMIGQVEKAIKVLTDKICRQPESIAEWQLKAELSQLTGNWDEAAKCWSALLRSHPEQAPAYSWDRLHSAQMMVGLHLQKASKIN